jgi:hypothetical protein
MTHIPLHWAIHMLRVAADATAGPLDTLHELMVKVVRCCIRYLFSSCSRNI